MPSRDGFILLFGVKQVVSEAPGKSVISTCPACGREASFVPRTGRYWLSIFFIPVLPVSGKQPICECTQCGHRENVSIDSLRKAVSVGHGQRSQRAITLFNGLHKSPANSVGLNELMQLHLSMSDPQGAIAAAGQFQQALNNSEQCMTTLARAYLAQGDASAALAWAETALERNDSLAEAYYVKAVAHLAASPPDYASAVTAARSARASGFPGAEELLREAEAKARG
jgi:tetratricopeptide (TPR) repeat protein